jgi:exodeoxyribonuclease V gamma subunit
VKTQDVVRVSISALLDFLTSPLQAWAKHRLRLREDRDEGDPLLREDEVFEPSPLDETILLREVAFTALAAPGDPKENLPRVYDELAARAELEGSLPTGVFLEATRAAHLRLLAVWVSNLASGLEPQELHGLVTHRFGPADERGETDALHGPLILELDEPALRVEVHGRTSRALPDAAGAIILVTKEEPDERHVLRAFLDHAVLAASGLSPKEAFRAFVVPGVWKAARNYVRAFKPFTPDEARAWLQGLVKDYVGGTHAYLLPIEAVLEFLRGKSRFGLASGIRWRRDNPYQKSSDRFGPILRIEGYEPPANAEAIARRRLGEFIARGGA